ncbi:MAG: hypothetical protein DWH81_05395 [Planctomycetota bacterium]|nr:MAG: hypothetical protein DWH81_05395 [Planctomycetota bacterium]
MFSPKRVVEKQATKLRFPILLAITGSLFVIDMFTLDVIPFADEILLGLVTVILANLRKRKDPEVIVQEPERKA